jgi:hypothetical protein
MRRALILTAVCLLFLLQMAVGLVISYVFGPLAFVMISVAVVCWVGWVVVDCWLLSALDDRTLALVWCIRPY